MNRSIINKINIPDLKQEKLNNFSPIPIETLNCFNSNNSYNDDIIIVKNN